MYLVAQLFFLCNYTHRLPTPPCTLLHTTDAGAMGGDGRRGDGLADELMGPDKINELMARSDYVVVAAALTPETRGMVGPEQLACSKEGQVKEGALSLLLSGV